MDVVHDRPGAPLDRPAPRLQATAEVDVASGPDPLLEATDGVEGGTAHHQVRGRGRVAGRVEAVVLVEEAAVVRVAGKEGVLSGIAPDGAGERADVATRRRREVGAGEAGSGTQSESMKRSQSPDAAAAPAFRAW